MTNTMTKSELLSELETLIKEHSAAGADALTNGREQSASLHWQRVTAYQTAYELAERLDTV